MTGPYYSIGPIRNVLLQASSISTFITEFRDELLSCNWTLISSFSGASGTPGYILKSYPTPGNLNVFRVKVWYNGDFSSIYPLVRFDISDENGASEQTAGSASISSDFGNKSLRCICGPHQFFVFIDTTISPNENYDRSQDRNNCMAGCPHVTNGVHSQVFWGVGGNSDLTFRKSLQNFFGLGGTSAFLINGITLNTGSFPDAFGNTNNCGPRLLSQRSIDLHSTIPMFDGNYPVIEPYLVMGRVPNKYWAVNLWDAVIVSARFSSKVLSSADNRTWESITLSTDTEVAGCLFLVTSVLVNPTIGGFSY